MTALAFLLTACGGGGGVVDSKTGFGGSGDPGPTSDALTASGPLSTVGVAAIGTTPLDDRAAAIFINTQSGQAFGALKLGMVAEVTGTIPANSTSTTSATATNILVESAVLGLVTAIDLNNQRLSVVSMNVQIEQNTIFEGFSALANLNIGSRVEVYGVATADAKTILATRLIMLPTNTGAPSEIFGTATNVSAFQFTVNGLTVPLSALTSVITPTGVVQGLGSIVENARVRVLGSYVPGGTIITPAQVVTGINISRNDNAILVLDGVVQSVAANGRFRLNDTDVETTAANAAGLTAGARVQVKGRKTAGVLVATDFRRITAGERVQMVVQGDIANFTSPGSFTVRGETINASNATYVGGTVANMVNGRAARIKVQANAGRLEASEVSFVVN